MKSLQITILLASPAIIHPFFMLDGLLQRLVLESKGIFQLEEKRDKLYDIPIPLKKWNSKENWFYHCSCGMGTTKKSDASLWRKQGGSPLDDENRIIPMEYGRRLYYEMPLIYSLSNIFATYCVGNKKEIERLLSRAIYIGKKRSQGYGRIKDIKIKEEANDFSISWQDIAMRPIPFTEVKNDKNWVKGGVKIQLLGFRPPYWHPKNQTMCITPGSPCTI